MDKGGSEGGGEGGGDKVTASAPADKMAVRGALAWARGLTLTMASKGAAIVSAQAGR